MANGYDRLNKNERGGGNFVMGLLTGTALGAGLGMLLAPKAGSELRNQLSEQAGALANQVQEGYRKATENASQWAEKGTEAAGEWAERGKDMYGKARGAVARGAEDAKQHVLDAAGTITGATPTPATASTGSSTSGSPSSYGSSPTSYPSSAGSTRGGGPSSSSADSPAGPSDRTSGAGGGSRPERSGVTDTNARTTANVLFASAGVAYVILSRPPLRRRAFRMVRLWIGAAVPAYLADQARQAWVESGRPA